MACLLVVLVGVLGFEAAEERPFLGVTMSAHAEPLHVDEHSFRHGVRIDSVIAKTAADDVGLRAGDIIVRADGVDFGCPTREVVARIGEAIRAGYDGTCSVHCEFTADSPEAFTELQKREVAFLREQLEAAEG